MEKKTVKPLVVERGVNSDVVKKQAQQILLAYYNTKEYCDVFELIGERLYLFDTERKAFVPGKELYEYSIPVSHNREEESVDYITFVPVTYIKNGEEHVTSSTLYFRAGLCKKDYIRELHRIKEFDLTISPSMRIFERLWRTTVVEDDSIESKAKLLLRLDDIFLEVESKQLVGYIRRGKKLKNIKNNLIHGQKLEYFDEAIVFGLSMRIDDLVKELFDEEEYIKLINGEGKYRFKKSYENSSPVNKEYTKQTHQHFNMVILNKLKSLKK